MLKITVHGEREKMKLIDADALIKSTDKEIVHMWEIALAPTVDPVKHGHWEVVDGTEPRRYGCSVCKRLSWTEDNYCSYCGAKMDEVEDADT